MTGCQDLCEGHEVEVARAECKLVVRVLRVDWILVDSGGSWWILEGFKSGCGGCRRCEFLEGVANEEEELPSLLLFFHHRHVVVVFARGCRFLWRSVYTLPRVESACGFV